MESGMIHRMQDDLCVILTEGFAFQVNIFCMMRKEGFSFTLYKLNKSIGVF
jgi:hypothetical protein